MVLRLKSQKCVYVYTHHIYVQICIYRRTCIYLCIDVWTYVCLSVCLSVCMYVSIYISVGMYVRMCMYIRICMYLHIYIRYVSISICMCMCVDASGDLIPSQCYSTITWLPWGIVGSRLQFFWGVALFGFQGSLSGHHLPNSPTVDSK